VGPFSTFGVMSWGSTTAIVAAGQGIGFAIPINLAKDIVSQLKEKGHVTRGWLGVGIQKVTPGLAESFGLKEQKGALVSQVFEDGPAEKAGIQQGDVILEFDGNEIESPADLPRIVAEISPGETVPVQVFRDGETLTVTVTIGEVEEEAEDKAGEEPSEKPIGMTVQNLTPRIAEALGLDDETGVVVTRVKTGSAAAEAGIQRGDVILEVNQNSVADVQAFSEAIDEAMDQKNILFLVRRGKRNLYVSIKPE